MTEFIKTTSDNDIDELAKLAREIWEEHFPPIIGMEQVQYMLDKFQSAQAMHEQIKSGYTYFRAYSNGELCGYCAICPHTDEGFMYLSKFYMKKDFRRRGIGREMMQLVENEARKSGFNKVRLNVNKYNFALDVYKRLGFEIIKDEVTNMESGFVLDDYVMEKTLTEE